MTIETESESTELSAGEQTKQRVLAAAVYIARADGIEAVTHKGVAAATGLSSSNVTYHVGTAVELRRAVAVEIVNAAIRSGESPAWFDVELVVDNQLGHVYADDPPAVTVDQLAQAEAYVWLVRNGVGE